MEKASIGRDSHSLFRRNLTSDTHPPTCSAFPKLPTPPPAKDIRTANKISKLVVFFLFQRCRPSVVAMETPASSSEVRPQLPPVALAASPQALHPLSAPRRPTPGHLCPHRSPAPASCSSWPGCFRCHGQRRRRLRLGWRGLQKNQAPKWVSDSNELPGGRDLCQGRPDMTELSKGPGPLHCQLTRPAAASAPLFPWPLLCPAGSLFFHHSPEGSHVVEKKDSVKMDWLDPG